MQFCGFWCTLLYLFITKTNSMKKLLLIALAAIFFTACNDSTSASATDNTTDSTRELTQEEKEERNKETALASLRSFTGETKIDSVFQFAGEGFTDYGTGEMPPIQGIDSAKASLQMWLNAVPDFKGSDFVAVADGDRVMVYGTWTGTWKNNFMGMDATRKSFKINDVDIFKFNDAGKIIEHRGVQSMEEIAKQIGMKMPGQ